MLTTANIVFLADESASGLVGDPPVALMQTWLREMIDDLDASLTANGVNARYGLVGFGELGRFAHSQLVDPDTSKSNNARLFGTAANLETAFNNLEVTGSNEDGWDAIDHAIAEYDFDDGSVPVFVLVQNDEGRFNLNATLTHDGVLAALRSKNVILNTFAVGQSTGTDPSGAPNEWAPLFDLSPYGLHPDLRILGVETDSADASPDGQHDYHSVDDGTTTGTQLETSTTAQALQLSFNGSNTGATGMVGSGKSVLIGQNISGGIGDLNITSGEFNYRAKSVPFAMVDMSTGTTPVTAGSPVSFPATGGFQFFGNVYGITSQPGIYVNEDGTITFGDADSSADNVDLSRTPLQGEPARPSDPMIAALWDDLDPGAGGQVLRRSVDVDNDSQTDLVIQWTNFFYSDLGSTQDPITFQAVLYADGRIQFNYGDLDAFYVSGTVEQTGGINATVGIWKGTPDSITLPAGKFVPGPHVIGGEVQSEIQGETPDSYVRMAWDTGGAAWDLGVVDKYYGDGGINSPEANALRDAFITSLGNQINAAAASGRVFRNDDVLLAIDYGSSTANDGFSADPVTPTATNSWSTTNSVDTASNSIPVVSGSKVDTVFQTVRTVNSDNGTVENLSLTITTLSGPQALTAGRYIVELFFAGIAPSSHSDAGRYFDVVLEGKTVLRNYNVFEDRAKITTIPGNPNELDAVRDNSAADAVTGIVKRFEIDVTDSATDGDTAAELQIDLIATASYDPALAGLRILRADPPRVKNIVLKGSGWADGVDYSYGEVVAEGDQLRPMYRTGADRIEVHFDGVVDLAGAQLQILRTNRDPITQTVTFVGYNPSSHVATWSLSSPLAKGKYALQLTGVTGSGGSALDGDWTNRAAPGNQTPTFDEFTDDPGQLLLSGNGIAGGPFEFFFSVLAGDYNQDGMVRNSGSFSDLLVDGDGNGDGVHTPAEDDAIVNSAAGQELPFRAFSGDYYTDDDIVNFADRMSYDATFGQLLSGESDGYLEADGGNFNGVVDAADASVPIVFADSYSAWYLGPAGSPPTEVGEAPRVMNVVVSGSHSMHAPFSFDTVDGSGQQLRTVPVGGADTISITFSENVNVQADHLTLVGLRTANRPVAAEFSYDIGSMTATWRFEGWALGDHYMISLSERVSDVEGDWLDGEWSNPASVSTNTSKEFPSGNGTPGGTFNFLATLLPGDANLDLVVTGADLSILYANFEDPAFKLFVNADFNGDGEVAAADYSSLLSNYDLDLEEIWLLADLNGDWTIDSADMAILYGNDDLSNPTRADGDLDGDGDIDLADVDLAFAQLGLELSAVA
jgi:hypothetical protein